MGVLKDTGRIAWPLGLVALLGFASAMATAGEDAKNQLPRDDRQMPPTAGPMPGGMAPGSDPFHILMNSPEVQADLKLTETQIRHLSRNDAGFRAQLRDTAHNNPEALQAEIAEDQNKIARVLTPEQLARFKEIMLQIGAPCSIITQDPDDSAKIRLSPSQAAQIGGLCQSMREQLRLSAEQASREHPNDRCAVRSAVLEQEQDLKKQIKQDVDRLLTDTQRKSYLAMQGRPFDLDRLPPPACE